MVLSQGRVDGLVKQFQRDLNLKKKNFCLDLKARLSGMYAKSSKIYFLTFLVSSRVHVIKMQFSGHMLNLWSKFVLAMQLKTYFIRRLWIGPYARHITKDSAAYAVRKTHKISLSLYKVLIRAHLQKAITAVDPIQTLDARSIRYPWIS